jgi:serine/threonine-protein kinase
VVWTDRRGQDTSTGAPARSYAYARLSPDERSIALDARDQQQDIWLWSASRLTRVTVTPELEAGPIWTPDGKALIFASQASGGIANLYLQPVNASGNPQLLAAAKSAQIPSSISPDGKTLIFTEINIGTTASDIMAMEMSTRTTSPVLQTTFNESNGSLSPDGRYLAYQSDQSGEMQVYVRSLIGEPIQVWPVSSGGGSRPVWARNGELFYVDGRGALIAVKTTVTPTFTADTPVKALNAGSFFPGSGAVAGRTYDVSADGQRFLVLRDADPSQVSATPQMIVILNWVELVRRQLAAAER